MEGVSTANRKNLLRPQSGYDAFTLKVAFNLRWDVKPHGALSLICAIHSEGSFDEDVHTQCRGKFPKHYTVAGSGWSQGLR